MTKRMPHPLTLALLAAPFLLVACGSDGANQDAWPGDASPLADTASALDATSVDGAITPAADAATRDGTPLADVSIAGSDDGPEPSRGDGGVNAVDAPVVPQNPADASADASADSSGDSLPSRQRLAVVVAVEEEYSRALAQYDTPLEQIRAVGRFMAGRSEYSRVLVDEEDLSITGELQNGWIHFVGNTPSWRVSPNSPANAAVPAASPVATDGILSSTTPQGLSRAVSYNVAGADNPLPATNRARLINAFENFGMPELNATPELIRTMLEKAGWEVEPGASGSVEALGRVGGDGFLYFQGHGGYGRWWDQSINYHCLQTSTLDDSSKYIFYQDDLDKHRLALITEKTFEQNLDPTSKKWVSKTATWFGITNLWVEAHWGAFSDNAVVFLNACHSGRTGSASSALFMEACQKKGTPNAIFGWSNAVDGTFALPAASYFVDRCVGANKFKKEAIAQRPFPWDAVLTWMHDTKKDTDPAGTQLLPFSGGASAALLAPTVRQVIVDEFAQEMKLYGAFGSDEGKVAVGNTPCPVKSGQWASDQITCELPPSATGAVVVEVRKMKSNPRPLTEWQFPINYSMFGYYGSDPAVMFSSANSIRYRLDVSGYREKPGEAPKYPKLGTWPVTDSKMTIIGSGTGPLGKCTATLTGSMDIPTIPATTQKPEIFLQAPLLVDTATKTGALGLALGLPATADKASPWHLIACGAAVIAWPTFGNLQTQMSFPQSCDENAPYVVPEPALALSFGTGFEILTSSYSSVSPGGGTIQVKWSTTAPTSPPDPTADGI